MHMPIICVISLRTQTICDALTLNWLEKNVKIL